MDMARLGDHFDKVTVDEAGRNVAKVLYEIIVNDIKFPEASEEMTLENAKDKHQKSNILDLNASSVLLKEIVVRLCCLCKLSRIQMELQK